MFLIEGVSKTMRKGDKLFRVENVDIAFIYALSNFSRAPKTGMDGIYRRDKVKICSCQRCPGEAP